MFRAIIKDRNNLNGPQIADVPIINGSISEDKEQKATSNFTIINLPDTVKNGDLFCVYDGTGKFYYWGVITSLGESTEPNYDPSIRIRDVECSQFESLYNDEQLIPAQTTANQKAFFNNKTPSDVIKLYLQAKELGYVTMANTMNATYSPVYSGFIDADLRSMYKGIQHEVIDDGKNQNSEDEHIPFPKEMETVNLEDFLYDEFSKYRRIIRPFMRAPSIPSEYQPVLYVESDGSGQYVDTGISPSDYVNTLRIELDGQFTVVPTSANQYLIQTAYYNSTAGNRRTIFVGASYSDSTFRMLSGTQQSTWVNVGAFDTERHLFVVDQFRKSYFLDNYTSFSSTVNSNLTHPFILFASRNATLVNAPISAYHPGRIYGLRIYNNDTELLLNLVPCYRKADGVVGFYDTVGGNFLTNSGTGSLTRSSELSDKTVNVAIINPKGIVSYDGGQHTWDYSKKVLFDTWEAVSGVNITDEEVETNTLIIYNADGGFRGAFTVLKDGTIQQMTADTSVENRYGAGKTVFVFDTDNALKDLAQANIPSSQFNHKITFNILFNDDYKFEDFNLGQPIRFYSKTRPGKVYESALTAWSYQINQNSDKVVYASFTLGNVRNNLTSKINLNVKKKK